SRGSVRPSPTRPAVSRRPTRRRSPAPRCPSLVPGLLRVRTIRIGRGWASWHQSWFGQPRPRLRLFQSCGKLRRSWQFGGRRLQWQHHDELRLAGPRLDAQVALVLFDDDPPGEIEPQAGAFTERFGGEERCEDAVDDLVRDAGAVVANLYADHVLGFTLGAQRQRAAAVHGLDRVVDDIGPDLIEIAWVAEQFGQRRVDVLDHLD